jgi:transcriptional regulator with PAS, ATPase and Fis domain
VSTRHGRASGLSFRADLFYRLGGVDLQVLPLRHRQADIVELSQYFLERHRETRRLTLSPKVFVATRGLCLACERQQ